MILVAANLLVVVCWLPPAWAQSVPPSLANGTSSFYRRSVSTTLLHDSRFEGRIQAALEELDPRVGIEVRASVPFERSTAPDSLNLAIYNILRTVETMEGITYYSASRERERVFYEESFVIASRDDRTPVADARVASIPAHDTLYALQRDTSFGTNVQRIDYYAADDEFLVLIENQTRMVYNMVPVVGRQAMRTIIVVRVGEDQLHFYGNIAVRVTGMFGLQNRVQDSFYYRLVALHDWFIDQLEVQGIVDSARSS